jgi:hypothetical protein
MRAPPGSGRRRGDQVLGQHPLDVRVGHLRQPLEVTPAEVHVAGQEEVAGQLGGQTLHRLAPEHVARTVSGQDPAHLLGGDRFAA